MLVLFETPAGYALFKVLDEGKLKDVDSIWEEFQTPEKANKVVKLKAFSKFEDTADAVKAAAAVLEGKLAKSLQKFLKKNIVSKEIAEKLAVSDKETGKLIKDKLSIDCVNDKAVLEVMRGIRNQMSHLIQGLTEQEMRAMALGLSHSLSRFKLKVSADKVDTMVIQAIGLLDDLDKELNNYAMRLREWFGYHFPELNKIVTENVTYAKVVKVMGEKRFAKETDLSDYVPPEMEQDIKTAAEVSMGTDISEEDKLSILALCEQVISLSEFRVELFEYLKQRMNSIAPNLTVMVGELVGARLISHAGSLVNLAKHPASTVQILGAEKALFRALKTKHETPKYGLIYHATLVGQTAPKYKGKISRVLAAKTALSIRVDALGEQEGPSVGLEHKAAVEARLRQLEGAAGGKSSAGGKRKREEDSSSNKKRKY
eukprot:GILI01002524.1.p1 GENE.GILI01002524.1~~GILI01002524.1.p1  ORF type:complete len:460 (+),score=176.04 GILI01002524.1:94-1380(+)